MTGTLRSAVAELVGTFIFVFAIIGAINSESPFVPLAIGFALMVLVYATGHISGGHLNPAVSVGVWLRGGMGVGELVAYIVAQLVAATLAALLSFVLWPAAGESLEVEIGPAIFAEALWTFVLVYVVLNTATSKDHSNNSFYGLAIGTTVFVGAVTLGGISGGGFNPAVALGLSITGQFDWSAYWLYFLAPVVGAALAAVLFRVLNAHDRLPAPEADLATDNPTRD